jgi:FlaA1/EpsC-like NDP-sugar epimerase
MNLVGVDVYAANEDAIEVMNKKKATILFVSPLLSEQFRENNKLVDALTKAGIKIMMLPSAETWDGKSNLQHTQLHEVEIEDLLPRDKIEVDLESIGLLLRDKRILITGAAGSIGSEMVRQVASFYPAELVLVDQAETPMHDVRRYMEKNYPNIKCLTMVTSISNKEHMEKLFKEHRPEYVFHAAAYKHVPMMENNPGIAVQNNIYGTRVIADLAVKYGTKKFVMISTDKAVNPTNVMGCSKRICEIYCQALNNAIQNYNKGRDANLDAESMMDLNFSMDEKLSQVDGSPAVTQFITTRFGNVLGSNGSVIPIFKEQIKNGGPVTVTDPRIYRYFMLIPEACQLVLEAGTMGNGGEIFVFDMGKQVRIAELAQRMIDLSGAKDVKIQYTGLRDGEKLFEETLSKDENSKETVHPKIKVAAVREYPYEQALKNEEELYKLSFTFDDMKIVAKMKEIVPEYKSQHSKYEALDAPHA